MPRKNKNGTIRDLVSRTRKKTGIDKEKIKNVANLYFDEIKKGILSGKQVRLSNFGTFELRNWKESTYYDPNLRDKITKNIKTVAFKPSSKLKEKIKSD